MLNWIGALIGRAFIILLVMVAALLLLSIPYAMYQMWKGDNSPTVSLNKSEWACTQTQTIPVTTYILSGKVMVPITTYSRSCTQWNRQP